MEEHQQVLDQCRAVAHMARAIASVYESHSKFVHPEIAGIIGENTARLMEVLGDILNSMDAVTEDDEWIEPILARAQELYPTPAPA